MLSQFEVRRFQPINRLDSIIDWSTEDTAIITIGSFRAEVEFYIENRRRCRGWAPMQDTPESGTGLFPTIDRCLREITEEYIEQRKPPSLFIYGDDAKRNNWNSSTYKTYKAAGYDFCLIKNTSGGWNSRKANSRGVVGVAWVRKGETVPHWEMNNIKDYIELL
jgi:hypothetical protein